MNEGNNHILSWYQSSGKIISSILSFNFLHISSAFHSLSWQQKDPKSAADPLFHSALTVPNITYFIKITLDLQTRPYIMWSTQFKSMLVPIKYWIILFLLSTQRAPYWRTLILIFGIELTQLYFNGYMVLYSMISKILEQDTTTTMA